MSPWRFALFTGALARHNAGGMTAITFALPDESRELAHALRHSGKAGASPCEALLGNLGSHELLLFHTGMGEARTRERLARFLGEYPVERVISAGYAGGLSPVLPAGALFLARNFSTPEWLDTAETVLKGRAFLGKLATSPSVLETPAEKAWLAQETGADAVDMETAAIHALCREKGVPLLSLRVISDTAREELAVPFSVCFDAARERPRPGALLRFLLRHPSRVPGFLQFILAMNRARQTLAKSLVELLEAVPDAHAGKR